MWGHQPTLDGSADHLVRAVGAGLAVGGAVGGPLAAPHVVAAVGGGMELCLEEVLGPEARDVINEVKVMQDHLGDLNDADVAGRILQDFIATYEKRQVGVQVSERRSIDRVIQYMADRAAEKHRLLVTFPEAWARFNRAEVRRAVASAVAIL